MPPIGTRIRSNQPPPPNDRPHIHPPAPSKPPETETRTEMEFDRGPRYINSRSLRGHRPPPNRLLTATSVQYLSSRRERERERETYLAPHPWLVVGERERRRRLQQLLSERETGWGRRRETRRCQRFPGRLGRGGWRWRLVSCSSPAADRVGWGVGVSSK
jgi:hypothetical protein